MAKKLPYNTDTLLAETQAMLDQTKAEGLKPFKGSSFESDFKKGIVTSDDARARAKNADKTITDITPIDEGGAESPVSALYKRLNSLQSELKKAKEAEKKAKDDQANADIQAKLKNIDSASEVGESAKTDISAGVDAILNDGKTDNIEDPVIRSLAEKTSANISIISNQMNTLENYRKQFNQYTKDDIDSIARTAERSIQRQTEENERTANAMRFAGVISGRAQFSPLIEQSIIKDVIQEGLDEIEVINEKKNSAIREARRAEAEFNVDAFEQQAELAKEYNSQIESAISNMNQRVREAEQDERARVEFRQAQEERNSLILAEELIDATPQQIMEAAIANGVDVGLLTKAVNDAKFTNTERELDIESKRASINAANRSNQPKDTNDDFTREEQALIRQAGLEDASYDEQITFLNMTASERSAMIKDVQEAKKEEDSMSVTDFISNMVGKSSVWTSDEFADRLKSSAKGFGIDPKGVFNDKEARNFLGIIVQNLKTKFPDITDEEIKEYLKQIPNDATTEEITAYLQFARSGIN